jgi:hypothetical protein
MRLDIMDVVFICAYCVQFFKFYFILCSSLNIPDKRDFNTRKQICLSFENIWLFNFTTYIPNYFDTLITIQKFDIY